MLADHLSSIIQQGIPGEFTGLIKTCNKYILNLPLASQIRKWKSCCHGGLCHCHALRIHGSWSSVRFLRNCSASYFLIVPLIQSIINKVYCLNWHYLSKYCLLNQDFGKENDIKLSERLRLAAHIAVVWWPIFFHIFCLLGIIKIFCIFAQSCAFL